jgi:EAL domain-containing protein (putative c-di-GMP-specific phosphodiesterase class I)
VEDAETLAVLRRLHVDMAQGYFIGYPSPELVSKEAASQGRWLGPESVAAV